MPKLQYPTLITWTDPTGRIHLPPDPPLTEGRPPWSTATGEYRRNHALARCPSLRCRRSNTCRDLIIKKYCRKTHMEQEAFRAALAAKLERLIQMDPKQKSSGGIEPPPRELKLAFQARENELEEKALRDWQMQWIEERKLKYAAKAGPKRQQAMTTRVSAQEKKP